MRLIDYIYGEHGLPPNITSKVENVFTTLYDKSLDLVREYYGIVYIVLFLLKLLPPINSRSGDVDRDNLYNNYKDMLNFMKSFCQSKKIDFYVDINMFEKKIIKQGGDNLNRIFLIYTMDSLIHEYHTFLHSVNLNESTKFAQEDMLWPDIDGIWCKDKEGKLGDFWKIEEVSNCYFLYHYQIKGKELEYKKYEMYLYDYEENDHMLDNIRVVKWKSDEETRKRLYRGVILNDELIKCKVNGMPINNTKCVFVCRIEKKDMPTIEFATNTGVEWFPSQTLYRIPEDSELYFFEKEWTKVPVGFNAILRNSLYAITTTHLYVGVLEDIANYDTVSDDRSDYGNYYKIPKSLNPAFDDVTINDAVGVMETEEHGEIKHYVAFPNFLQYYDVTTPEAMKRNGIEMVDKII